MAQYIDKNGNKIVGTIAEIKEYIALESGKTQTSKKNAPKTKKSTTKKSAPKQTYDEAMTELHGDKEQRTKFAKLRGEVRQNAYAILGQDYYAVKKSDRDDLVNEITNILLANPKKKMDVVIKEVFGVEEEPKKKVSAPKTKKSTTKKNGRK